MFFGFFSSHFDTSKALIAFFLPEISRPGCIFTLVPANRQNVMRTCTDRKAYSSKYIYDWSFRILPLVPVFRVHIGAVFQAQKDPEKYNSWVKICIKLRIYAFEETNKLWYKMIPVLDLGDNLLETKLLVLVIVSFSSTKAVGGGSGLISYIYGYIQQNLRETF